jgi:antitoxin MazE
MSEVMLDIKQWGNSLGVRLPARIAREAHLHLHQRVRISVVEGMITLSPIKDLPLTLEQRLASFDPLRHGGEAMQTSVSVGAEKW